MDYIFDWARDIYREAIIGELRKLSANNTASLANDSDVFSLMDRAAFWPQEKEPSDVGGPTETETLPKSEIHDTVMAFDSPYGVLRDATYINSRFMALYIAEENLSVLMQSMQTWDKARKAAETILRCLKDSWRVTPETLDALELRWAGKDREESIQSR